MNIRTPLRTLRHLVAPLLFATILLPGCATMHVWAADDGDSAQNICQDCHATRWAFAWGLVQPTLAHPTIQILFQLRPFLSQVFDGEQVFPFTAPQGRYRIREAEGDELDETGEIAVRQITALVPAKETESAFGVGQLET